MKPHFKEVYLTDTQNFRPKNAGDSFLKSQGGWPLNCYNEGDFFKPSVRKNC